MDAALTSELAPTNSPEVFLTCCGVVGLGRLLAEGDERQWKPLRKHANDPRWRVREAVVLGLQRLGDVDMKRLLGPMMEWGSGNGLEQRAAVAVLCEPRLLKDVVAARATHAPPRAASSSVCRQVAQLDGSVQLTSSRSCVSSHAPAGELSSRLSNRAKAGEAEVEVEGLAGTRRSLPASDAAA